jgi:serine/threonine-protein kinase
VVALANSTAELARGQTLDRYELVYPVARGGMARVWVAKLRGKHGFEKMVALKTILPTFAEDQRFRRMFLDEAKIASGIEHVNVAQILDLGEQDGQLYLVMEWVDGDSLQELDRAAEKAGGTLPIPVLIRVVADACAGLHAAHELSDVQGRALNVVHRDVSPQNILISSKGIVKVIDFGVVKARRRATEETSTGTIKGKLQYMAPEQALGHGVDRRADIWSVGATLYRLLARRPVYRGNSPLSTFKRLTSALAPEPLPSHVPGALASIVHKALAFEPERRFSSAAELGAALEALLQGPYQTTAREVAACVDLYLGPALAARRSAIGEALDDAPREDRTQPTGPEWESGVSQAKTLARGVSSAPPSSPTIVDRPRSLPPVPSLPPPATSPSTDEVTRPLHPPPSLRPSSLPSSRSKLAAAGGVVALGGVLVWAFATSGHAPEPRSLASSPPPRASTAPPAVASVEAAPLSVQALPVLGEAPPATVVPSELPPLAELPPLEDASRASKRKPAPLHSQVVPKQVTTPKPVAVAKPVAAAAKPRRKVVDDGF